VDWVQGRDRDQGQDRGCKRGRLKGNSRTQCCRAGVERDRKGTKTASELQTPPPPPPPPHTHTQTTPSSLPPSSIPSSRITHPGFGPGPGGLQWWRGRGVEQRHCRPHTSPSSRGPPLYPVPETLSSRITHLGFGPGPGPGLQWGRDRRVQQRHRCTPASSTCRPHTPPRPSRGPTHKPSSRDTEQSHHAPRVGARTRAGSRRRRPRRRR